MLVLSRKLEESVVVGGPKGFRGLLKITVLDLGGGRVRLGFEGDRDIVILRSEIWQRLCADRQNDDLGQAVERPLIPEDALAGPK